MSTPSQPPETSRIDSRVRSLISRYGDGTDGSAPTAEYGASGPQQTGSGAEAMMRYAAVSGPALEKAGGHFLLTAPFEASLMGEDEEWDMVAIGRYPSLDALFALFDDEDYAAAFSHRRAALERQRVVAVRA